MQWRNISLENKKARSSANRRRGHRSASSSSSAARLRWGREGFPSRRRPDSVACLTSSTALSGERSSSATASPALRTSASAWFARSASPIATLYKWATGVTETRFCVSTRLSSAVRLCRLSCFYRCLLTCVCLCSWYWVENECFGWNEVVSVLPFKVCAEIGSPGIVLSLSSWDDCLAHMFTWMSFNFHPVLVCHYYRSTV